MVSFFSIKPTFLYSECDFYYISYDTLSLLGWFALLCSAQALTKNGTDAMKESRVHDFLASVSL